MQAEPTVADDAASVGNVADVVQPSGDETEIIDNFTNSLQSVRGDEAESEVEEENERPKDALEQGEEYLKKLAANNTVQNIAKLFAKKKTEDKTVFVKSKTRVDMSKFAKPVKADYGLKMSKLRQWNLERTKDLEQKEESLQLLAVSKVRGFMDAVVVIVRLQSWVRMIKHRNIFLAYRAERAACRKKYFKAWKLHMLGQQMRLQNVIGKPFRGWQGEVEDRKRLQIIVLKFFQASITKLKLTPQSVMCFFSQQNLSEHISESDINKIRRLILQGLFDGWNAQVRSLKSKAFKASQILARMMRRTKGPLYTKEAVLVCFHLWMRYVAVRLAYRREELDPHFTQPLIPQWNNLYQLIIVQRIKKKRAAEMANKLTMIRMFRVWRVMMAMDKSKMLNPQQRADVHYAARLETMVIRAWSEVVRERGRSVRRRNKIFYVWANWAPKRRRMRKSSVEAFLLANCARKRTAYNVMKSQCYEVIGKRATALKLLRQNICNRKLMVCAYALGGFDAHVMFLDCWRRWQKYWRARWRWKTVFWQYQLTWYQTKFRAIFDGWKQYTEDSKKERSESLQQGALYGMNKSMQVMFDYSDESTLKDDESHVTFEHPLMKNITYNSLDLFERSLKNLIESKPDEDAYILFCRAILKSSANKLKLRRRIAEDMELHKDDELDEKPKLDIGNSAALKKLKAQQGASEAAAAEVEKKKKAEEDALIVASNLDDDLLTSPVTAEMRRGHRLFKENQQNLQRAIDYFDLAKAAACIENGAEVLPSHIRQIMQRVGDEHIPFLGLLLGNCKEYLVERVLRKDRRKEIFYCHSPLGALLTSTHIDRWEKRNISQREITRLTKGRDISDSIGSGYQSFVLWRLVMLMLIKKKADDVQNTCQVLKENRSVDEEVAEVMKRKKVARQRHNRDSIRKLFGLHRDPSGASTQDLPALVRVNLGQRNRPKSNFNDWVKGLDIFALLKEFTLLTGKLTAEAQELRNPMINRDNQLLRRGIIKQYKGDLKQLRWLCLTPEQQRDEEAAKAKLARQQAVTARKKAVKKAESKKSGVSSLASLLVARDGAEVLLDVADHNSELVFIQRSQAFKNILLETWEADGWRHKSENTKSVLIMRHRKEAVRIFHRLVTFFSDMLPSRDGNGEEVHYLPNPVYLTDSGYSGYILTAVMKFLNGSETCLNEDLFDVSSVASTCAGAQFVKYLSKWIPVEWWAAKRIQQSLNREIDIIVKVMNEADLRAKTIQAVNQKISKQKNSHVNFLKTARSDILAVTDKAGSIMRSDRQAYDRKVNSITSTAKEIQRTQKSMASVQSVIGQCEVFIGTGRIRQMMEMLEIRVPDLMDAADEDAFRYKAYGIVDEKKRAVVAMRVKIHELEQKKSDLEAELKAFNVSASKGRRILNNLASDKLANIMEIQAMVSKAVKTQKANDLEKSVESQAKKIVKCYVEVLQDLSHSLFMNKVGKIPKTADSDGGRRQKGNDEADEDDDDVDDDGEADDQDEMKEEDLAAALKASEEDEQSSQASFESSTLFEGSDVDESEFVPRLRAGGNRNVHGEGGSIAEPLDDDDSVDSTTVRKKPELDAQAIGFGSSEYQQNLLEDKMEGNKRKASLTAEEKLAIAVAKEAEEKERAKANETEELRMRIFDEYWFSLGEDIKGKKEMMRKERHKAINDEGDSDSSIATKGVGRTREMFKRTRGVKRGKNLKYKSVYDEDYVDPDKELIFEEEGEVSTLLSAYCKTLDEDPASKEQHLTSIWRSDVKIASKNGKGNDAASASPPTTTQKRFGGAPTMKHSISVGLPKEDEAMLMLGFSKQSQGQKSLFAPPSKVGWSVHPEVARMQLLALTEDPEDPAPSAKTPTSRKKLKRKKGKSSKTASEAMATASLEAVSVVSKEDPYSFAGMEVMKTFKCNRNSQSCRVNELELMLRSHGEEYKPNVDEDHTEFSDSPKTGKLVSRKNTKNSTGPSNASRVMGRALKEKKEKAERDKALSKLISEKAISSSDSVQSVQSTIQSSLHYSSIEEEENEDEESIGDNSAISSVSGVVFTQTKSETQRRDSIESIETVTSSPFKIIDNHTGGDPVGLKVEQPEVGTPVSTSLVKKSGGPKVAAPPLVSPHPSVAHSDENPSDNTRFTPVDDIIAESSVGPEEENNEIDLGEEEGIDDTSLPFPISYVRIVQTPQGSNRRERISKEGSESLDSHKKDAEVSSEKSKEVDSEVTVTTVKDNIPIPSIPSIGASLSQEDIDSIKSVTSRPPVLRGYYADRMGGVSADIALAADQLHQLKFQLRHNKEEGKSAASEVKRKPLSLAPLAMDDEDSPRYSPTHSPPAQPRGYDFSKTMLPSSPLFASASGLQKGLPHKSVPDFGSRDNETDSMVAVALKNGEWKLVPKQADCSDESEPEDGSGPLSPSSSTSGPVRGASLNSVRSKENKRSGSMRRQGSICSGTPSKARNLSISGNSVLGSSIESAINAATAAAFSPKSKRPVPSTPPTVRSNTPKKLKSKFDFSDEALQAIREYEPKGTHLLDSLQIRAEAESEEVSAQLAKVVAAAEPLRPTATKLVEWRHHHHGHIDRGILAGPNDPNQNMVSLETLVEHTLDEKMSKQEAFALSVMDLLGSPTSPSGDKSDLSLLVNAEKKIQSDSARRNFVDVDDQAKDDVKKKKLKKKIDFIKTHLTPINEKVVDVDISLTASMSGSRGSLSRGNSHRSLLPHESGFSNSAPAPIHGVSNHIEIGALECSAMIIEARVKESLSAHELPPSPPFNKRALNRAMHKSAAKRAENYSNFAAKWKYSNSSIDKSNEKGDASDDDISEVSVTSVGGKHIEEINHFSDDASDDSAFPAMLKNRKDKPVDSSNKSVNTVGTAGTVHSSPSRNSNRSDLNRPQKPVEIDRISQSISTYETKGNHGSCILSIENDENGEAVHVPLRVHTAIETTKRENKIRESVGVLDGHSHKDSLANIDGDTREVLLDDGTFKRLVRLRKKPKKYPVKVPEKRSVNISLVNDVVESKASCTSARSVGELDVGLDEFDWDTSGWNEEEEPLYYYDPDLKEYVVQPKELKHSAPSDRVFFKHSSGGQRASTRGDSPSKSHRSLEDFSVMITAGTLFGGLMPGASSATVKLDEAHNTLKIQADKLKALPTALEKFMASTAITAALPPVDTDGFESGGALHRPMDPLLQKDDTYDDAVQLAYDTILDYKTQLSAEQKIYELEKNLSRVSSPSKAIAVAEDEPQSTPQLLDSLKTSLEKTLEDINVKDHISNGTMTPLSLEGSVVDLLEVQPNTVQVVRSDTAERSRRTVREKLKSALQKPESPSRPITPLYVDEDLGEGISGKTIPIRSKQDDRAKALGAALSKMTEKDSEDSDKPVHIEDTVPLGNNTQFSINIDIRSTGSPTGSFTGPGSKSTSHKNASMEAPMSPGIEGVDHPYSRATLLSVTPNTQSRTLQDYFQNPELDVAGAVNKSREQRLQNTGAGSRSGFSRPANEAVPEHAYGEEAIEEDSELHLSKQNPFLPSISQTMTAPSVGAVIGHVAPIPPNNAFSESYQFEKGSYSNSMFDEINSEDEEDDEEYMERELRKMLEEPARGGKTMPNMRKGTAKCGDGLSNSMSMLPSIAYSRGTISNKKEPKVFGGNPNMSNKRKVARQGNLLTVSDSLPNLDKSRSTVDLGLDTVKVVPKALKGIKGKRATKIK